MKDVIFKLHNNGKAIQYVITVPHDQYGQPKYTMAVMAKLPKSYLDNIYLEVADHITYMVFFVTNTGYIDTRMYLNFYSKKDALESLELLANAASGGGYLLNSQIYSDYKIFKV